MSSCSSCGKSVADGAAFCAYCGASTTAPVVSDPAGAAIQRSDADYWICGSCHSENLVGDAFCQTCGVARASADPPVGPPPAVAAATAAVPVAGMEPAAYGLMCASCCTANEPDASFCHACGVPLVAKTAGYSSQPAWAAPSPAPKTPGHARWIVLAAIIVAVAAAVVIGVVLLGGRAGEDEGGGSAAQAGGASGNTAGATGETSSDTTVSTTPTEFNVTGNVTSARASSSLDQNEGITYVAWNLLDGNMETCWAEGVAGYGIGETVYFKFSERMTLTRMDVMPGYKKYGDGVDRWYSNGRLREITVTFADGSQEFYPLSDSKTWQPCDFGERKGSTLEFTIDSVYHADSGTDRDADDTSVSEVRFYGWPASEGTQ